MRIESIIKGRSGDFPLIYEESDPLEKIEGKILLSVHGFCFYKDKMIVVYSPEKGYWTPPGGGIEEGEHYEEALIREIKEETNMKVISHKLIGYQDVYEPERVVRQTRSFCLVEPYGDFISDPDGDITEIKLIDPKYYKQYFDWGEVGERIVQKALGLYKNGV